MKKHFELEETLGNIVARFAGAADIFNEYKIDYCCHGDRTLKTAVKDNNINEEEIIEKLDKAYEKFLELKETHKDWREAKSSDLIDYIVNTHHAYIKNEFPKIASLVQKILRVHYVENGPVLSKVHQLFSALRSELEGHLIKEEEVLFPLMKEYDKNPSPALLEKIVKVMTETEAEHEGAGDILRELRSVTNQYELPTNSCGSYKLTFDKLQELEVDLFKHIHLENSILFKRYTLD